MLFSRGSVWSKWDLHIHTPASICNKYVGGNEEEIWEKFISHLESLPKEVEVIGINDYYFIDGFEKVMNYKYKEGRLKNIKKIFPVLEFRIDTFGTASESKFQKINLHILFSINDKEWEKDVLKIKKEFISQIHLSKLKKHETKILSIENMIEDCGNKQKGFEEIIPNTEEIFNLIHGDTWKDKVFTLLGYKEWNNIEKGNQLKQFKDELYKQVNAFFTACPDDNFSKKQTVLEMFGDKVLVHSDDIHDFEKLKIENYRCLTWIKSDKTFDGLRQILIEPKERIKIQESNPFYSENKTNVIDFIKISNSSGWFEERKIKLNSGLVSIIGEKGAGKTALLDLIAIANDEGIYEKDVKVPYSFYNRAKDNMIGLNLDVEYLGGSKNSYILDGQAAKNKTDKNAKVRYLSLKELESYCDEKYKFQEFIKEIILDTNPMVKEFDIESKRIIDRIKSLNNSIYTLSESVKGIVELNKALDNKKIELENHIKNQPKIATNFSKEQEEEYEQLIYNKQANKNKLDVNMGEVDELRELLKWISNEERNIKQNFKNSINIKSNTYTYLNKSIVMDIDIKLEVINMDKLQERVNFIKIQNQELNKESDKIKMKIKPLEELNKNLVEEKSITLQWYEAKTKFENEYKILEAKKKNIENNIEELHNLREQLKEFYIKLIKNKLEQKSKFEELKSKLEMDNNIEFKIEIEINEEKLFSLEDSIIRHNQGNSQEKIKEGIKEKLLNELIKVNKNNLDDELENIKSLIDWINSDKFINDIFGMNRNADSLLKNGFDLEDFYNWIFDDYYEVNYFISFKGRPLEALSPGQKGLALMKLFLKLDNSTKPLLIDQPEDNLDNKSVYSDLVNDIKEIKRKRQVIIATHNPNLVVNTDSEQVIIAKFEDNPNSKEAKIRYYSGALENVDIRKEVCDILEGGDRAFIKREERYCLDKNKVDKPNEEIK